MYSVNVYILPGVMVFTGLRPGKEDEKWIEKNSNGCGTRRRMERMGWGSDGNPVL